MLILRCSLVVVFLLFFCVQTRVPFLLRNWISSVLVSGGNRRSRMSVLKVNITKSSIVDHLECLPSEAKMYCQNVPLMFWVHFDEGPTWCDDRVHDCVIL